MKSFRSLLASFLLTAAALTSAPAATAACPSILVTPVSLPNAYSGTPYVGNSVSQTGGTTVAFSITSGALPTGLSMNAAGSITGTPTVNGTFIFTATATDSAAGSAGCTGGRTFVIVVGACQAITVNSPGTTTGTVDAPFSQSFTQTGAVGTATFTLNSGTLPAGLSLAPNGTVSGTPSAPSSTPITVKVTDSNGCTGISAPYTLVISCQTITVTNPATTTGTVDAAFGSQSFTQSGVGTHTPAVFSLNSGSLPSGLSLSAAGVLSGTPGQPGSFPITVKVTDSNGCTGISATYTLVIACQTITVTNPGVTTGTVDAPFSQTFTQSGVGTHTPATFTINSGTLPSGLSLSAAGVLSGTPGAPGSFPITVKVTDANGCFGISATYTLVIACQTITVTAPGVTTGTISTAFSQSFTQSGVGTHTPATFTTASTLPNGITLSTAGLLAGTPTQTGTFPIVVTVTDANGCTGTSATYTLAIAPTANNDAYVNLVDNTQAAVTGGLTGTPTTPFVNLTGTLIVNDLPAGFVTATAGTSATTALGSVTIATDGTFIYTPKANPSPGVAIVADSFTYTVSSNTGGVSPVTSAPATVNLTLANRVWYVKDNGAAGNGQSQSSFNTLAAAQGASTANDIIFIYLGGTATTPLSGGISLKNGQKLWGEGFGLTVNTNVLVAAGTKARIRNTGGDAVSILATGGSLQNVEVKGLDLESTSGSGVFANATGANALGVTISNDNLRSASAAGFRVTHGSTSVAGLVAITSNTFSASTGNAIDVRTTAGTLAADVSTNTGILSTASGIVVDGSGGGTLFITGFANNTVDGSTVGSGVLVTSATFDATPGAPFNVVFGGTTTIGASGNGVNVAGMVLTNVAGDLSFTDLDIFSDGGAGLKANGTTPYTGSAGFQIAVGAGVATSTAIGGPAVDLTTVSATLPFSSISSTNSTTTGVNLDTVVGTFSAPGGSSITNSTGTDFNINAGNATVTYGGTIVDTTGRVVSITNTTGGVKSFSGAITNNGGTGIFMNSNAGATMNFSGGLALTTGANDAFTATGAGPAATTGGTVTVTGAANVITTTSGTPIKVVNTTIGAGGLIFRSVSANGAANGIFLDNTGASGGLTVTGNSVGLCGGQVTPSVQAPAPADCTGGVIQNVVGADATSNGIGIFLRNTSSISLTRMDLHDFQNFAIRGFSVAGFTLDRSYVHGVNGSSATENEGSVSFGANTGEPSGPANGLTGVGAITLTTINGGFEDNLRVTNQSGSLNRLTLDNVTIGPNDVSNGNDGVLVEGESAATINVTVQNSALSGARATLFAFILNGNNTADLVFQNNAVSNPPAYSGNAGSNGLTLISGNNVAGGAITTYSITGNTFRDANGHGVLLVKSTDPGSLTGTFSGNTIGLAGIANSGSFAGSGIKIQNAGLGTVNSTVTTNSFFQYNNFGIEMLTGGGASALGGAFNATVTGNTVSNPGTGGLPMNGIHLNGGTNIGDTFSICTKIGGAGALANAITGSGLNAGTDFRLRQRQATTVRLPGYGGANNDNAAVVTFLQGVNGGATGLASNTVPTGGGFIGTGTTCP